MECMKCHKPPRVGELVIKVEVVIPVNMGLDLGLRPHAWVHWDCING